MLGTTSISVSPTAATSFVASASGMTPWTRPPAASAARETSPISPTCPPP